MRPTLLFAVGLVLVSAVPAAAQTGAEVPKYRIEIEKAVSSAIRERDGVRARWVSIQFQLRRTADDAVVTDVPREQIVVEEDGVRVKTLDVHQPRGQKLTVVLAMDVSG